MLHPFASAPDKTWPADRFAALAAHLEAAWGLEPVFAGGAGDDFSPFGRWRRVAGAPLAEVKSLLAGASLFAGNDSGPAHMAAALGLPMLVLFGASDARIWHPWKAQAQVLAAPGRIADLPLSDALAALEKLRVAA